MDRVIRKVQEGVERLPNSGSKDAPPEEPEYRIRCTATKHSWRGRYKRIFCITASSLITLDPNSLASTNAYDLANEFESVSVPPHSPKDDAQEFTIHVRAGGKGKFQPIKFSTLHRVGLLTELQAAIMRMPPSTPVQLLHPPKEFSVLHLRRTTSEWAPCGSTDTAGGPSARSSQGRASPARWSFEFRNLGQPAVVRLASDADGPAARSGRRLDDAGFILCSALGKRKAFKGLAGASDAGTVLAVIEKYAKECVGLAWSVDTTSRPAVHRFLEERGTSFAAFFSVALRLAAAAAQGPREHPLGEWTVTRLVGFGGADAAPSGAQVQRDRLLTVTQNFLVEKNPASYEACAVRPLGALAAVVRWVEEPQVLGFEFLDGTPDARFSCASRDSLLACLKDAAESKNGRLLPVLSRPTKPGHRLDWPCAADLASASHHQDRGPSAEPRGAAESGAAEPGAAGVAGARGLVPHARLLQDEDFEALTLKHLVAAAREAVAEGGSIQGSKARLWRRVCEFNAFIPYEGIAANADVPDVLPMAVLSMLPSPAPLDSLSDAEAALPLPPPSPAAAATLVGLMGCLRRLLHADTVFSLIVGMPGAIARFLTLCRSSNEAVAAEAAGLVMVLISVSRVPALLRGNAPSAALASLSPAALLQWRRSCSKAKAAVFFLPPAKSVVVGRLCARPQSPLLSMAIVDVLQCLVCEPGCSTTDDDTFFGTLKQFARLGRLLFLLFSHPAASTREAVGVLMRTVAEEDPQAAAPIRQAALYEGALLRHFANSVALPAGEPRAVSRELLALWVSRTGPAMEVLRRCLPPGLQAVLAEEPSSVDVFDSVLESASSQLQPEDGRHIPRRIRRAAEAMKGGRYRGGLDDGSGGMAVSGFLSSLSESISVSASELLHGLMAPGPAEGQGRTVPGASRVQAQSAASVAPKKDSEPEPGGKDGAGGEALPASDRTGSASQASPQDADTVHATSQSDGVCEGPQNAEPGPLAPDNAGVQQAAPQEGALTKDAVQASTNELARPQAPQGELGNAEPQELGDPRPLNWTGLWREFEQDHHRADLIWNEKTRQELREALLGEVHLLEVAQEREEGGRSREEDGALEGTSEDGMVCWNFSEFAVRYPSLSHELRVGDYFLRLFLNSSGNVDMRKVSPGELKDAAAQLGPASAGPLQSRTGPLVLRSPKDFFLALYHRFLREADMGLEVEGIFQETEQAAAEAAQSDWCRTDEDAGKGAGVKGESVRELCVRAMSVVYAQHWQSVGEFQSGACHVAVLLDRTMNRSLRHRLLLLLHSLLLHPANAEAVAACGGCEMLVDLLASAHEAESQNRANLPSLGSAGVSAQQQHLLADTAYQEPAKEWFYMLENGARAGPVDRHGLLRAWGKGEIGWGTKCWAAGMGRTWKRLCNVRELRWLMAQGPHALTPAQVGQVASSALLLMLWHRASSAAPGGVLVPTPRVQSILSSQRCLPHIAQALLTGEPAVVENSAAVLEAVVGHSGPDAASKLYLTGAFLFACAYRGSNLQTVASLFKATHLKQSFLAGADATVASALPLSKRSVLGALLPESLLFTLETHGASAFAAAMAADSDTPEIIWTHSMRGTILVDQILSYLGDFPHRLSQYTHALFEYAPIPPLEYPELKDEMWCHRYYLHNLCDEARFPDWPVIEHVELLQSILALWREEMARKPMDVSDEEAFAVLGMPMTESGSSGDGPVVDEEVLKRQYRKMAIKFHPDKNPDEASRDKFLMVQRAYEHLQMSLKGLRGPQRWRVLLLLRSQALLFRRYPAVLQPFKYPAYPLLLDVLDVEKRQARRSSDDRKGAADGEKAEKTEALPSSDNYLSHDFAPVTNSAAQLLWLSCACSSPNAEQAVREGALRPMASLIVRCVATVSPSSTPVPDPAAALLTSLVRSVAIMASFSSTLALLDDAHSSIVRDTVQCTSLAGCPDLVHAALEGIYHMAASQALRERLLQAGAIWYLVPLLLLYDPTAEEPTAAQQASAAVEGQARGAKVPASIGSSKQAVLNQHAALAARALGRLAGLEVGKALGEADAAEDAQDEASQLAYSALRVLLTPTLAAMLADQSPVPLLRQLATTLESAQVIWNMEMRAELLAFLEDQRLHGKLADGTYDTSAALHFAFKSLQSEIQVGNVYLRLLVHNPSEQQSVADPAGLCASLLEFLRTALLGQLHPSTRDGANHSAHEEESLSQAESSDGEEHVQSHGADPGPGEASLESSLVLVPQSAGAASAGFRIPEDWEGTDASASTAEEDEWRRLAESKGRGRGKGTRKAGAEGKKREYSALDKIILALKSLKALASAPRLAPLTMCLRYASRMPAGTREEVQELTLEVLSLLAGSAACRPVLTAPQSGLLLSLLLLLVQSPPLRSSTLNLLHSFASTPELAWAVAKQGGAVLLLTLVQPAPGTEVQHQHRAQAVSLLTALLVEPSQGRRVALALTRLLPTALVIQLRDNAPDLFLAALGHAAETPELVWSHQAAMDLGRRTEAMAKDVEERLQHYVAAEGFEGTGEERPKGPLSSAGGFEWEVPDTRVMDQVLSSGTAGGEAAKEAGKLQVGGVYVHLFLKDPKYPLRNPRRFLEGLLDRYVAATAVQPSQARASDDPELLPSLAAALVALLRVQPGLADHAAHLGYVPKLLLAMSSDAVLQSVASPDLKGGSVDGSDGHQHVEGLVEEDESGEGGPAGAQAGSHAERVRLCCLMVLHQLSQNGPCAEVMSNPGLSGPQVIPLLMKAVGWHGAPVLALETMKRLLAPGNRSRDSLVAQALKAGLVQVLLAILDWGQSGSGAGSIASLGAQMQWSESEASVGRVLAVDILNALAEPGAYSIRVKEILDNSEVWKGYRGQRHDLYLPASSTKASAGVAAMLPGPGGASVALLLPSTAPPPGAAAASKSTSSGTRGTSSSATTPSTSIAPAAKASGPGNSRESGPAKVNQGKAQSARTASAAPKQYRADVSELGGSADGGVSLFEETRAPTQAAVPAQRGTPAQGAVPGPGFSPQGGSSVQRAASAQGSASGQGAGSGQGAVSALDFDRFLEQAETTGGGPKAAGSTAAASSKLTELDRTQSPNKGLDRKKQTTGNSAAEEDSEGDEFHRHPLMDEAPPL